MADTSEYRVTIRLPAALYAQLQARGSQGQPLAAIVRHALVDYLSRHPDTPQSAVELATAVAAMAARLDGLQAVQEGTCDEPPFEWLCFRLFIRNWHFVTKMGSCPILVMSGEA